MPRYWEVDYAVLTGDTAIPVRGKANVKAPTRTAAATKAEEWVRANDKTYWKYVDAGDPRPNVDIVEVRQVDCTDDYPAVATLAPGDYLWDMHNHPSHQDGLMLRESHHIVSIVRLPMRGGAAFIDATLRELSEEPRAYLNKMLVYISDGDCDDKRYRVLRAVFSYDDRTFGVVEIRVQL